MLTRDLMEQHLKVEESRHTSSDKCSNLRTAIWGRGESLYGILKKIMRANQAVLNSVILSAVTTLQSRSWNSRALPANSGCVDHFVLSLWLHECPPLFNRGSQPLHSQKKQSPATQASHLSYSIGEDQETIF